MREKAELLLERLERCRRLKRRAGFTVNRAVKGEKHLRKHRKMRRPTVRVFEKEQLRSHEPDIMEKGSGYVKRNGRHNRDWTASKNNIVTVSCVYGSVCE